MATQAADSGWTPVSLAAAHPLLRDQVDEVTDLAWLVLIRTLPELTQQFNRAPNAEVILRLEESRLRQHFDLLRTYSGASGYPDGMPELDVVRSDAGTLLTELEAALGKLRAQTGELSQSDGIRDNESPEVEALAIYQTVIDQVREYGRGYDGLTILLDLADICFGLMTELEQVGTARQPVL